MNNRTSRSEELQERFISFAAGIIEISLKLPRSPQGRHISDQILRSGTATAANYAEARGAESRADFVHKLRIVLKELNETAVWLQLIGRANMLSPEITDQIVAENHELCRLIAASVRTSRESPQSPI